MAQYAIAFDLDTKTMVVDGFTRSQIIGVYQKEIPQALSSCGFTAHPQGSLYHTESDTDPINAIMRLQGALQNDAPTFCKYVRRVHVFRMEEWSDVTKLVSTAQNPPKPASPMPDEEFYEAMYLEDQRDIRLGR